MELPRTMPTGQEHRRILGEFYDINKNRQWFKRAELIENHPSHMKPTIEIYCDYTPVLEMKELLEFTTRYNLALNFVANSNQ